MAELKFVQRGALIWALTSDYVSLTEKMVLLALNQYADAEGWHCYPSTTKLAKDCCLTRPTTSRVLSGLAKKGFIEKTPRYAENRQTSNLYRINYEFIKGVTENDRGVTENDRGVTENDRGCHRGLQGVSSKVTGGVTENDTEQIQLTDPINKPFNKGEQKKSNTSKADFDDLADARINHSSLVSKENNPEGTKLPSENLPEVTTKNKQYRQGSTVPPESVKSTSLQSKRVRSRKEQVKSLIGDRTEDAKGFLKWRGEQLAATDFYKNTNVTEDVVLHFYAKKLRGFSDEEKAEALQEVTEAIEVDLQRWPGRNQQKVKSQKEALFDEIAALHEKDPVAAMELGHQHHVWNAFYWERLRNA